MKRYLFITVALLLVLMVAARVDVLAQEDDLVYITNPGEGEVVSGIVPLTGAVDFPDFQKFDVFLKTGEELIWAATGYSPVINGNIIRLDTRAFADGIYQLVIRKVRTDSNYTDFTGPTFIIENGQGAPRPYPEVEPGFLYPTDSGAIARYKNCSGENLEVDYMSPEGFCSSGDLFIPYKPADIDYCPTTDVFLKPCEYRGTARGVGDSRGATYSFQAQAGSIYTLIYSGGDQLYVAEIEGDERVESDTGGLNRDDPARYQPPPSAEAAEAPAEEQEAAAATTGGEEAEAESEDMLPVSGAEAPGQAAVENESLLPVSGQGTAPKVTFVVVAVGLILLLVVGGVIAARKRGYTAW